jgi:hypothetical protein
MAKSRLSDKYRRVAQHRWEQQIQPVQIRLDLAAQPPAARNKFLIDEQGRLTADKLLHQRFDKMSGEKAEGCPP